jgi:hypothetical protein
LFQNKKGEIMEFLYSILTSMKMFTIQVLGTNNSDPIMYMIALMLIPALASFLHGLDKENETAGLFLIAFIVMGSFNYLRFSTSIHLKKGTCLITKSQKHSNRLNSLYVLENNLKKYPGLKSDWSGVLQKEKRLLVNKIKNLKSEIKTLEKRESKYIVLDNFKDKGLYYMRNKESYTINRPTDEVYFKTKCNTSDHSIIEMYSKNKESILNNLKVVSN